MGVLLVAIFMAIIVSPIYSISAVAPQVPSVIILESYLWTIFHTRDAIDIDTDNVIQVECK